jgi:hypothetical protein
MSSRRRKTRKGSKCHKKWQIKQNGKKELKKLKNTKTLCFQCKLSPLDRHYQISSLNHPISKSSINFVHNLSPFVNELIKDNPREE